MSPFHLRHTPSELSGFRCVQYRISSFTCKVDSDLSGQKHYYNILRSFNAAVTPEVLSSTATCTRLPIPRQPVPAPTFFSSSDIATNVFATKLASVRGVKSSGSGSRCRARLSNSSNQRTRKLPILFVRSHMEPPNQLSL